MSSVEERHPTGWLRVIQMTFWVAPPAMFAYVGVKGALDHEWALVAIMAPLSVIWLVTIIWRLRSGIRTWTPSATVVGLLSGVRPTSRGLEERGHRAPERASATQSSDGFDALAARLHNRLNEQGPDNDHPSLGQDEQDN